MFDKRKHCYTKSNTERAPRMAEYWMPFLRLEVIFVIDNFFYCAIIMIRKNKKCKNVPLKKER